jgi:tetratricopeptide (TPR) repeat protein
MLAKLAVVSASLFLLPGGNGFAAEPDILPGSASANPAITLLRSLFVAGRIDAARVQAQSLVEANPGDARSLALLGDILFRQSWFADAERVYRRAVQADPRYGRGHWGLGRLAMLASRRIAARDHFAAAFQLDPHDPDIILAYADTVPEPAARVLLLRNYLALARKDGGWKTQPRGSPLRSALASVRSRDLSVRTSPTA